MSETDEQHGQLEAGYPHALRPELHKALTAYGIDYWVAQGLTFWNRDDGCECLAYGYEADGVPKMAVKVVGFTDPEQAIAATLGRGTCKPTTYDDGYLMDRLEPGEYHEFWEPACACGNCGELIPMRKFCPNCGCRLEVEA